MFGVLLNGTGWSWSLFPTWLSAPWCQSVCLFLLDLFGSNAEVLQIQTCFSSDQTGAGSSWYASFGLQVIGPHQSVLGVWNRDVSIDVFSILQANLIPEPFKSLQRFPWNSNSLREIVLHLLCLLLKSVMKFWFQSLRCASQIPSCLSEINPETHWYVWIQRLVKRLWIDRKQPPGSYPNIPNHKGWGNRGLGNAASTLWFPRVLQQVMWMGHIPSGYNILLDSRTRCIPNIFSVTCFLKHQLGSKSPNQKWLSPRDPPFDLRSLRFQGRSTFGGPLCGARRCHHPWRDRRTRRKLCHCF